MGERRGRQRQALSPAPGRGRPGERLRRLLPVLVVGAMCFVSTVVLVLLTRGLWFFGDDWDFLLRRGLTLSGPYGLLQPHNEHWATVPILAYRLIFSVVGLGSYLPYALLPIGVHVACTVLLFVVLRRLGVRPWVTVVTVAFLAFLGAGAENLEWDFQIAFFTPLMFALAAVAVAAGSETIRPVRGAVIWLLLVLGLMSSGVGISGTIWVTLFVLGVHGVRTAVVTALLPALVYLVWFATYGHGHDLEKPGPPELVLETALKGMADAWQRVVPVPGFGGVFLLLLVVVTLVGRGDERLRSLAAAGLAAMLPFYLLVAVSRVGVGGTEAGMASRYAYVGVLMSLPALALALTVVADRVRERPGLLALTTLVLVTLVVGQGVSEFVSFRQVRLAQVADTREVVLAGVGLAETGQPLLTHALVEGADVDQFLDPAVRGTLPHGGVGPQARLEAASQLQVAVSRSQLDAPMALAPGRVRRAVTATEAGGCVRGTAGATTVLALPATPGGAQVSITSSGGQLGTRLSARPRVAPLVLHQVRADTVVWVATTSSYALRVVLPAGTFEVCSAGAS